MANADFSKKGLEKKFNSDLKAIIMAFSGVSHEKRDIIAKPVGKLIGSYVKEKIGREVNKSLYAF